MRRTMESVAAERLNKIGIRDHNITNGSASENENTSAGMVFYSFKVLTLPTLTTSVLNASSYAVSRWPNFRMLSYILTIQTRFSPQDSF